MDAQPVEGQVTAPIGEVWLSLSQIAGLKKVSVQAISKRVKRLADDGLINVRKDGREQKVNLVEFDRAIGANTDPAQELRNPGGMAQPTASAPDPNEPTNPQYAASRALRESYQAEDARLDLEERTGRLVDKDEVEARTFRVMRRARDRFLSLPAMVAPRVFNATDERTIRQIIDEEVRKVCDALAAELDADADVDAADEDLSDAADGDRDAAQA